MHQTRGTPAMSRLLTGRSLTRTATAATLLTLAALTPATTATAATTPTPTATATTAPHPRITSAYELPGDRAYPEGITTDPRTGDVYVGSYTTGAVYKATPGHHRAEVFLPAGADGRNTANGLRADRAGRLWVTDSTSGVSVYDLRSRTLLARFDVPGPDDAPRMVNDIAITPDGTAYLTDSSRAVIYRVTPGQLANASAHGKRGELTVSHDLGTTIAPHPADAYTLNGIVADPSGRYLLTVDMTGGDLYRVDLATGAVREVTPHGGDFTNGDGMELRGRTLWVVQNRDNTVARWRLDGDGTTARLEREVTDPALQIPTTIAHSGGHALVVRSQFDKGGPMGPGTPTTPFTVADVDGI
ncbi:SMP-30/gluconolactonase/LRE family protein [Streptomyces sp. NPDC059009]|uniref:SMP-30/gluconolactonase/LRE family protein n=1 Tax=Streptomyces sp. NPDC059009 TaxID=3346694 RepID=UPI0036B674AF